MPFWKKSDDPWDRRPGRPPAAPEEPEAAEDDPLETLRGLGEKLKSAVGSFREPRPEEPEPPPERCPWCQGAMERGYLHGQGFLYWQRTKPKALSLTGHDADARVLNTEGGIATSYRTAWECPACRKLVVDVSDLPLAGEPVYPGPFSEAPEEREEE
ncbi:PF20097 family protein [uncultured Oscillibacter sp.]|uniref:PF20097 family protein n=1 Tax=uncultured Oscillibacter sp. TaxID=876091 RepID=UPI0025F28D6F|nr:PF20097 family protein [uncultured Oscillibacter sp.]